MIQLIHLCENLRTTHIRQHELQVDHELYDYC
jgi:hypothetical protein